MKAICLRALLPVLALFLALSVFACSGDSGVTTKNESDTADIVTEAETDENLGSILPETNLDGYEYRILAFKDANIATIFSDTLDGNLVNDAVYKKIKTVEEFLNVSIRLADGSTETPPDAEGNDVIKKEILSGIDTFDIVQGHDVSMGNMSLEGYFVNLYNVPYLDFTKPWWPDDTIESLTVNGQMYFMSNNIAYFKLSSTRVFFFNKTIFSDLNLDHPYADVYDGTWTLDKLNGYAKQGYKDLNGNGEADADDCYGLVNPGFYYCWLEPFKVEPYVKDESGRLYYSFDLDKMQALVEKFHQLLFGGYGTNVTGRESADKMFADGKAMFLYDNLSRAVFVFAYSDVVYGTLPMPKLYETDKEYYGGCTDRPLAIPVTATNIDKTGIVTEALNFAGYKIVYPAYYEVALKTRYADQTDDAKMIDIVHNNAIMSLTYIFGDYQSPYNNMLEKLFNRSTPSTDVASYAKSIEKAQNARVKKIMEFYDEKAGG